MTPLRQRMLDALILRGYAPRTQEAYVDAVSHLACHYHSRPDTLSIEQVQGLGGTGAFTLAPRALAWAAIKVS